jgi:hypothetical protein
VREEWESYKWWKDNIKGKHNKHKLDMFLKWTNTKIGIVSFREFEENSNQNYKSRTIRINNFNQIIDNWT